MSTESGLPDFRSMQGLWSKHDSWSLSSVEVIQKNTEDFIAFYRMRITEVLKHTPHEGYHILAKWQQNGLVDGVITQNVDGYHAKAGSENVAELHGTLATAECQSCKREIKGERFLVNTICECGGMIRPSIILFGEVLPEAAIYEAESASIAAELFIVLGSSLQVTPANQFPLIAKKNGSKLVIANETETELDSYADLLVYDRKIGDWIKELDQELFS